MYLSKWDNCEQIRTKRLNRLSQRLHLTSLHLEESQIGTFTQQQGILSLRNSLLRVNSSEYFPTPQLLMAFRGIVQYYNKPAIRVALTTEILRYMAEFRAQSFNKTEAQTFLMKVKEDPLAYLKDFRFEFVEQESKALAFVANASSQTNWTIFVNLRGLNNEAFGGFSNKDLGLIEHIFIHELVHLIQFQANLNLENLEADQKTQDWEDRWLEQEAVYVSERVYRSLLYPKQTLHPRLAKSLVQKIAYRQGMFFFDFKEDALTPYQEKLKQEYLRVSTQTLKLVI